MNGKKETRNMALFCDWDRYREFKKPMHGKSGGYIIDELIHEE